MAALFFLLTLLTLLPILFFSFTQAYLALTYRRARKAHKPLPLNVYPQQQPKILVQLPVYNERYVIERLLRAVGKLKYPKQLLTIQLLDDASTDDTAEIAARVISEIAASGGHKINYVRRPSREGFKAGALSYGMNLSDAEFIVIFDADFVPAETFIVDVLPYFANPRTGMVQTRWGHLNAKFSILTRLMAMAIDNHFTVEQGGRQAANCFLNFNGTAGMWRRQTIEEAGGWSGDCLTEDLDLSFRAQAKNWQFVYVEQIETMAELPVEMQALRSQQARWTKGAVETARKNLALLWRSTATWPQKIIGTAHMLNSGVFVPLLIFSVLIAAAPFMIAPHMLAYAIMVHLLLIMGQASHFFTHWVSDRYRSFSSKSSGPLHTLGLTFLFLFMTSGFAVVNATAAMQGLLGIKTKFARTPKLAVSDRNEDITARGAYRERKLPPAIYLEMAFFIIFFVGCIISLRTLTLWLIDIQIHFLIGFGAVIYFTLRDHLTLQMPSPHMADALR